MMTLYKQDQAIVGREAFYCAYNHSDERLRGALDISYPLVQGHVHHSRAFLFLLRHAFECAAEVVGIDQVTETKVMLNRKPTLEDDDFNVIVDALFSQPVCSSVSVFSEGLLAIESAGIHSALLVDIGASSSYVVALRQGVMINSSLITTAVGGEHVTELLCTLLDLQPPEEIGDLKRQVPRCRMQVARQLKEDYGYVATDFDYDAAIFGRSHLDQARRLLSGSSYSGDQKGYGQEGRRKEIRCGEEFDLPDGTAVSVGLDCERFYCTEVLFSPAALESCQHSKGLVRTVLEAVSAVNESVRAEVCSTVLITGRSALLPGMAVRLERDLKGPFRRLGIPSCRYVIAEEADWPPSAAWNGVSKVLQSLSSGTRGGSAGGTAQSNGSFYGSRLTVSREEYLSIGPRILNQSRKA